MKKSLDWIEGLAISRMDTKTYKDHSILDNEALWLFGQ